jgi:hypothetical protein
MEAILPVADKADHASRAHAEFSMSSLGRVIACPLSYTLSKGVPRTTNEFAERGTLMHECGEAKILTGKLPTLPEGADPLTKDELEIVNIYVDYINGLKDSDNMIWWKLEHKVKVNDQCWGTADGVVITQEDDSTVLYIIDLKTGFISVEPDCSQLKGYALGVLKDVANIAEPSVVRCVIVQPKDLTAVKTFDWTADEVWSFEKVIDDTIASATGDNPSWSVGDHCRWCPAAPTCAKIFEEIEMATKDDDIDLGKALHLATIAENWAKRVRQQAESDLKCGKPVPGWKLVRGRSLRKWMDIPDVHDHLESLLREEAFEKKYISPTQAEKLIGKEHFKDTPLAEYVIKPEGKITIAPESDKRQAVATENDLFDALD